MMKQIIALVIIFLAMLPFVFAIDCDTTSNPDYCDLVKSSGMNEVEKDKLYSTLLYSNSDYPDHEFIEKYNSEIIVSGPPENTPVHNSKQIKNAWLSFLSVFPSVYEDKVLYVNSTLKVLSQYNYEVEIPPNYHSSGFPETSNGDCQRTYQLVQNDASLVYYNNGISKGFGKFTSFDVEDGVIKAELSIDTKIRVNHYRWRAYKIGDQIIYKCEYSHTHYESDHLSLSEGKEIEVYRKKPSVEIKITNEFHNTTKGSYYAENFSYFKLSFEDSHIIKKNYFYDLVFDKKPYHIAYLKANNISHVKQSNIYLANSTFFVKNTARCALFAYNHFHTISPECDLTLEQEEINSLHIEKKSSDLRFLVLILTFLLVLYILYKIAQSQFKKIVIPILLLLLCTPFVAAAQEQEECGITNLASCIPQKMYEFLLVLINAPLLPMLAFIKTLLTAEVYIELFYHIWSVVRYILSFFYVFLFLYSGFVFLTANANPFRRSQAKEMLKNTILMIVLIQGSFYFYGLILNVSSILSSSIISLIDPHFFLLTADNIINIGLELIYALMYSIVLAITMIMLVLRYIIVSFGVIFVPIAIFCYFIPPLKGYGRFILHMLGIMIFVTFFDLLIILGCSMIIQIPLFENFKILVMITCFFMINYTLWLAFKFAMKRSSNSSIKDDLNQAVKYIAMLA